MTTFTDTTLMGNGGTPFATRNFDGAVPWGELESLFAPQVHHTPIYTNRDGKMVEDPNRRALVNVAGDVLNVTSPTYEIHQFSDVLLSNLNGLLDSSAHEVQVAGAGLLNNGAVGWVQVQVPERVVRDDRIASTLTLASSHNGTLATSYRTGLFRFVCSNQIGALRRRGQSTYRLRHTRNSSLQFDDAREALGLLYKSADDAASQVETLVDQRVTDLEFERIVARLNPQPTPIDGQPVSATATTRWENRRDTLRAMWTEDERVAPYRGTAWGVVQAFNTYRQWERPHREMTSTGRRSRLGRQMAEFLGGDLSRADERVYEALSEVVG